VFEAPQEKRGLQEMLALAVEAPTAVVAQALLGLREIQVLLVYRGLREILEMLDTLTEQRVLRVKLGNKDP